MDRLYDRSRVVCDWVCPRKRYWQYEYDGKGIVRSGISLELFTGTVVHDCLAAIATQHPQVDIDLIAVTAFQQMKKTLLDAHDGEVGADEFAFEQATLVEGMLRGFYKHVWPRLLLQFPVIKFIEKEVTYKHDGLVFMSKPDLIMEDKEGEWHYIEYKTTRSKKEDWVNSWQTAVQLHSSIKAVEQTLGQAPLAVTIVGLYKGYESYGKQNSPFCYAYKRNGNPPFTKDEIQYGYKAGFKRYATWELAGGVKKWVEEMPEYILSEQYPITPPILIDENLVERFFNQRGTREKEIHHAVKMIAANPESESLLDDYFPQKFDQCTPYFGKKCEYSRLCHGYSGAPLTNGFTHREPHHEAEMEQQKNGK